MKRLVIAAVVGFLSWAVAFTCLFFLAFSFKFDGTLLIGGTVVLSIAAAGVFTARVLDALETRAARSSIDADADDPDAYLDDPDFHDEHIDEPADVDDADVNEPAGADEPAGVDEPADGWTARDGDVDGDCEAADINDELSPSPVTATVIDELQRLDGPQGSFRQAAIVLALSFVFFMGAETLSASLQFIVHLIVVLAFHEAGHFVAMKLFGYRDMKVFFIPFLGAAVSGKNHTASGTQRAIVSLAGPVPGIVLALVLLIGTEIALWNVDEDLTSLMLVLNALNLLPFEPLDGGRLMNVLVYHRHPRAEAAMRALGAMAMLGAAFVLGDWFLGIFGASFAIGLGHVSRVSHAAAKLRPTLTADDFASAAIPVARHQAMGRLVAKEVLGGVNVFEKPKMLASAMNQVWAKALVSSPSAAATVVLLTLYLLLFAGLGLLFFPA